MSEQFSRVSESRVFLLYATGNSEASLYSPAQDPSPDELERIGFHISPELGYRIAAKPQNTKQTH